MTEPPGLAEYVDLVARRSAGARAGVVIEDLPHGGWLRVVPGADPGEFASTGPNRLQWYSAAHPLPAAAIDSALDRTAALGCSRAFFWLHPAACDAAADAHLKARGAAPVPYVRYTTLVRAADPCDPPHPATGLKVSIHTGDAAAALIAGLGSWFGKDGVNAACRLVGRAGVEAHAAFAGPKPVSLGLLFIDGPWSYLGWAGTDPEHRRKGAQTSLIRSRVQRAAEANARWCCSETNTAIMTSLNNLMRCGFVPRLAWSVYRWDAPAPSKRPGRTSDPGGSIPPPGAD